MALSPTISGPPCDPTNWLGTQCHGYEINIRITRGSTENKSYKQCTLDIGVLLLQKVYRLYWKLLRTLSTMHTLEGCSNGCNFFNDTI